MSALNLLKSAVIAGAAVAAATANPAAAASLVGDSITATYYFPDLATVYGGYTVTPNPTFTVGSGVEATGSIDGNPGDFDFAANSFTLTLGSTVGFSTAAFNGWQFVDNSHAFGSVVSVTGIDASRVTTAGNTLSINWNGVSFNNGDAIVVNFGVVPEPASWVLMVGGLGLVGLSMRRRSAAVTA